MIGPLNPDVEPLSSTEELAVGATAATSSTPCLANPVSTASALLSACSRFSAQRELAAIEPIRQLKPLVRSCALPIRLPSRSGGPIDMRSREP
jgi:hypothetical protein